MKSFYNFFLEKLKSEISIVQLMKKHNASESDIKKAIDKGIKVEMEHTTDVDTARRIASQHIEEMLNYYDRLAEMES
jgi:hypothetical protein